MKVTLFMAISLNGIIARENNEEDFLSEKHWETMRGFAKKFGNTIWGRRTQEVVKTWESHYHEDLKNVRKVVVSKNKNYRAGNAYTLISSPQEALEILVKEGFKEAFLIGGSTLNSSFLQEGLINEIIINIEPAIVSDGIPVFKLNNFNDVRLKLLEIKKLEEGIVQLRYKVLK